MSNNRNGSDNKGSSINAGDKKREVKKIEDMLPFDPFKVLGLPDPKYKKYATINRRMLAVTIDTVIATFTLAPIMNLFVGLMVNVREVSINELSSMEPKISEFIKLFIESGKMAEFFLQSGILLLVSAICWKFWSATPGKLLLGMRIVDVNTEKPINSRQIIIRSLGYIVSCSVFFLGIIWIGFDKRRQGWHDKMAGTAVIILSRKEKEENELSEEAVEKAVEEASSVS
ncbi:MAG: RDD family protein [Rickettsiales bacterium]